MQQLELPHIELPTVAPPKRLHKLARTAMRSWVARHLKLHQQGLCLLCGKPIDLTIPKEGVVDHDHETGEIRGVLHRSCNSSEGKARNAIACWGSKSGKNADVLAFAIKLVEYWQADGTGYMYPMHKTPEEKAVASKAKAAKTRAATKARKSLKAE